MSQVIIVSNRLPVSVKKENGQLSFYPSVGGLATGLSSYVNDSGNTWVGWPGIASDELTEAEKQQISEELAKHNCAPVFLTQKQLEDFYNGYSNSVLWPLFHNLRMRRSSRHEQWWRSYRSVNKRFCDIVISLAKSGSTIWVHDYQLMLLPELLRAEKAGKHIGFFLHIPFPDTKTLTKLPEAKSLIDGMLGADLVGFHTTGYVANFLSNCVQFRRGTVTDDNQISFHQRIVRATEFPMGIDYQKYAEASKSDVVKQAVKKYKRRYKGMKVIVAVDRLDPSKGLVERLLAYREFLEISPELHGKIILSMVASPSRTEVAAYKNLKKKLDILVFEINEAHGTSSWQPIDYINYTLPFEEVTALLQIADVAFIAPLRDGMNLVAKEFIASSHQKGVLILSETAGAAEELRDALLVDPRKPETVVDALQQALNMPTRELRDRLKRMQTQLATNTVQVWAGNFMKTLNQPLPGAGKIRTRSLRPAVVSVLADSYHRAQKRLLLLDYDGTLVPFSEDYLAADPPASLMRLIKKLSQDKANEVIVISGRSTADLDAWFGGLPINMVAEHGVYVKKKGNKNWTTLNRDETSWKQQMLPILQKYSAKTPYSKIEEKTHSLVWHYRRSPPYYAQKNAVAIKRLLAPLLRAYGLQLFTGNKVLEIKDPNVNKGAALSSWLHAEHDFIMAIGDDFTDEDMFAILPTQAYSIKVGRGLTEARYRLQDSEEVIELLKKLAK